MAGSKTPVQGCLFNEVASVTRKRPFFVEHLLATTSRVIFFYYFYLILQIDEDCSLKSVHWWSNSKLGEGIHKLV